MLLELYVVRKKMYEIENEIEVKKKCLISFHYFEFKWR